MRYLVPFLALSAACCAPEQPSIPADLPIEVLRTDPERAWIWIDSEELVLRAGVGPRQGWAEPISGEMPFEEWFGLCHRTVDRLMEEGGHSVPLLVAPHGLRWQAIEILLDRCRVIGAWEAMDLLVPGLAEEIRIRELDGCYVEGDLAGLWIWRQTPALDAPLCTRSVEDPGPVIFGRSDFQDPDSLPADAVWAGWLAALDGGSFPVIGIEGEVSTNQVRAFFEFLTEHRIGEVGVFSIFPREEPLLPVEGMDEPGFPPKPVWILADRAAYLIFSPVKDLALRDGAGGNPPVDGLSDPTARIAVRLRTIAASGFRSELEGPAAQATLDRLVMGLMEVADDVVAWRCREVDLDGVVDDRSVILLSFIDAAEAPVFELRLLLEEEADGAVRLSGLVLPE